MKALALDIGDVWIGIALSDSLGITCRPLKTVKMDQLVNTLHELFCDETIDTVIIGYPKTMKGGQSEQTKKIIATKEILEQTFNQRKNLEISWILFDERLSSKRARELIKGKKLVQKEKNLEHARAAAFILQSYLDSKTFL